ncbi:hypothetical protein ACFLU7_00365 [Chloroflexota bacterium]
MVQPQKEELLQEWIVANNRIDNIDARIWQGAGILLVVSIGGFSIVKWYPPQSIIDYLTLIAVSAISIFILAVWFRIYQRWMYMQDIYGYRIREIENELGLRLNLIARIMEYWESREENKLYIANLKAQDKESYLKLAKYYEDLTTKKKYGRIPLYKTLNILTWFLVSIWISVIILYTLLYLSFVFHWN